MNVDSIFLGPFVSMLRSALTSLLMAIVPAMTESTNLFQSIYGTWDVVLVLSEALLSVAFILSAYSYFAGVPLHNWQGSSATLARLVIAAVAMPFTLYLAQTALNLNDAMASFILPYSQIASFTSQVVGKLGGYSLGALALLSIVVLLLYLLLIVRMLLVFLTAALLPVACLCYSIQYFRNFGLRLIQLFLEFTFMTFFMAVAFRISLTVSSSSFFSLQVPPVLIAGSYLLPLLVPFLVSPTGQRVASAMGIPGIPVALGVGFTALAAAGSYAAGLASAPLTLIRGRQLQNTDKRQFASHRGNARYFAAGNAHGTRLISGAHNPILARRRIPAELMDVHVPRARRRWTRIFVPPHRIYEGRGNRRGETDE